MLNEHFGTILDTTDRLFFDQMEETWLAGDQLVAQAKANPLDDFRLLFADRFLKSIVGRMDDNADILKRILDNSKFGDAVMEHYLLRSCEQARATSAA